MAPRKRENLHVIDDVLIFTGYAVLGLAGLVLLRVLASFDLGMLLVVVFLVLTASVALGIGHALRRREDRIIAIWNVLRSDAEMPMPRVIEASGFARADVADAIRTLTARGFASYVHDGRRDVIIDERLAASRITLGPCPHCGAPLETTLPLDAVLRLECTYCQHAVGEEHLARFRARAAEPVPPPQSSTVPQFNPLIFAGLFVCFWPVGLLYAIKCFAPHTGRWSVRRL